MIFSPQLKYSPFPFQLFFLSLIAVLSSCCQGLSSDIRFDGLSCADHPAADPTWNPVLVRSWVLGRSSATDFEQEAYLARYSNLTYLPVPRADPTKYRMLDLFYTAGKLRNPTFRMYFQREVKVYMLVDVSFKEYNPTKSATLLGWQSEGWAERAPGPAYIVYGVHVRHSRRVQRYVYVFSKFSTDKKIDIPETRFVKLRIGGLSVRGSFNLLIAERDGSMSPPVGNFKGRPVLPNQECPAELHDAWYTVDTNVDDTQTQGLKFSTWHPTWDPCHWCAYDHDHGSSPKNLFGYEPKFHYVAFKNDNENEAHRGFKGFVFETKDHYVYYNTHVHTSSLRRVDGRFHTIHLVIADKKTGETVVDIAHKGDFGFQSVRLKPGNRFLPISESNQMIQDAQTGTRVFRSIAVIDEDNLVPDYFYRSPLLIGNYEEWRTLPICAGGIRNSKVTMRAVFKQPATGIKSLEEPTTRIDLGIYVRGRFVKSPNMARSLLVPGVEVSDTRCPDGRNGYFYTDVFGRPANGPSERTLRQYVKPGIRVTLEGRFEPEESWIGMHGNFRRGFFIDHGYGINPETN